MSLRPSKRWTFLIPVVLVAAALVAFMIPRGSTVQASLIGSSLQGKPAPDFKLRDQFGHTVSLSQMRGHPVILTLMESQCQELCPGVANSIRRAVAEMGPTGKRVRIIALSADPEHDTTASIRHFSRVHGLLKRWHYVTAGRAKLAPIWHAYHVYVAPADAPASVRQSHTSATFLIDSSGRERSLFLGAVSDLELAHDLQILAGVPVTLLASNDPSPEIGHPAPNFTLKSTAGKTISLSSLRGHLVLVNFWASWCKPCRAEMPMLASWYRKLHRKGFEIVGVDQQEPASDAGSFARKMGAGYTILLDSDGSISARYDVIGLPTTYLVDRNGIIRNRNPGEIFSSYLRNQIQPVLSER